MSLWYSANSRHQPWWVSQQADHWQCQGVLVVTPTYILFWFTVVFKLTGSWEPPPVMANTFFFSGGQRWWCVTAGRALAVAISGGGHHCSGLVTWLGLDIPCPSGRCGLDSLDLRLGEPQPWRLEVGLLHFWSSCLWQLNPQTGTWPVHGIHPPSPSSTSQRVWNILQGTFYKNLGLKVKKYTYPCSVPHYGPTGCWKLFTAMDQGISTLPTILVHHQDPTGRWKLPTAMEKGSSAPPTLPVWDLPQNKCWDWWIHWMFLLVCAVILGKYFGTLPFAEVNLNILGKDWRVTRQTISLRARTHLIALGTSFSFWKLKLQSFTIVPIFLLGSSFCYLIAKLIFIT